MFVAELTVFDPPEAKLKRRPYQCRLWTEDATAEQLISGITLLGILADRITKLTKERYPGAIESFLKGDTVLKYGRGQVTEVEQIGPDVAAEAPRMPQEPVEEEDEDQGAPSRRTAPGTV